MNLRNQVESFLNGKIPLATAMGVRVVTLEPLMIEAPVALNSNHLGTAFEWKSAAPALRNSKAYSSRSGPIDLEHRQDSWFARRPET